MASCNGATSEFDELPTLADFELPGAEASFGGSFASGASFGARPDRLDDFDLDRLQEYEVSRLPGQEAETETLLMLLRGLDRAERVAVREDEGLKASKREKARMKTGGPGGRQPLGVNRMRRGAQA